MGHHRCAGLAVACGSLAVLVALAAPLRADDPPRPRDTFGGVASGHIVVQLTETYSDAVKAKQASTRSATLAAVEATASAELLTTSRRWNASRMSPVFSFGFGHPNLAARYGLDRYLVVETNANADVATMAADYTASHDEIAEASVDSVGGVGAVYPNDAFFDQQWWMNNDGSLLGSVADADIDAPEAWDIETGIVADPVTIAIIDSGVNPHPEISSRLVPGINTADPNPSGTSDDCSITHGTHVAGIAAAGGNNNIGVAGVCWGCNIMPVDVLVDALGGCSGYVTDLAEGIVWAADHGADVINMSLQYCGLSTSEQNLLAGAVNYAHDTGVVLVAATGNNLQCGAGQIAWPARLDHVIAVGGITKAGVVAVNHETANWTSNWGDEIDLVAPGDAILSLQGTNGYQTISGTSMATPHVSGIAALVLSHKPELTDTQVEQLLIDTAVDIGDPGWDNMSGHGLANAFGALHALEPSTAIPTVSTWGMVVMLLLALTAGTIISARRRAT